VRDTIVNVALMDIYFNVGRRYQVSEVMIDKRGPGAEYVEDDMLKRIVGLKEYDYYSVERNRQSQVRLFRTGLFSNVTVAPSVAVTFGSFVPI
jgi:outer membrane translocation and assembly module TamA